MNAHDLIGMLVNAIFWIWLFRVFGPDLRHFIRSVLQIWSGHKAIKAKQSAALEAEEESSICSDQEWNELAYGPGSTWFDTAMLIESITEELEAPLNRARNAANFVLVEAKQDAADILHEAKAERDAADEAAFYEWMKKGSILHEPRRYRQADGFTPKPASYDSFIAGSITGEHFQFDAGGLIEPETTIDAWGYNNVNIRRFRGRP
jgi:hypothetical protein